jgi:DNA methylase
VRCAKEGSPTAKERLAPHSARSEGGLSSAPARAKYVKRQRAAVQQGRDFTLYFETESGKIFNGDAYRLISSLKDGSVDLIVRSPPFGLVRKKEYGNVQADEYLNWFRPFASQFHRVLKNSGSLVIDIGGAWNEGTPTRHLYHFKLLIMLCEEYGFHLAQDFYWWNPAKLPAPAEWVTIRRIRVKDAINKVW